MTTIIWNIYYSADYASVSQDSKGAQYNTDNQPIDAKTSISKTKFASPMAAEPTLSHYALVAMHKAGILPPTLVSP